MCLLCRPSCMPRKPDKANPVHLRRLPIGQTLLAVSFLSEAIKVLSSGAGERSTALGRGAEPARSGADGPAESGGGLGLVGVLRQLQSVLAEEMTLSLRVLRQEEEKAAAATSSAGEVSVVFRVLYQE